MVAAEICCTPVKSSYSPKVFPITHPFSFGIKDVPVWHTGLTRGCPAKLGTIFPWLVLPHPPKRARHPGRRPAPRGGRRYLRDSGRRSARSASCVASRFAHQSAMAPETRHLLLPSALAPGQRGALARRSPPAAAAPRTAVAWRRARECQFLRRSRGRAASLWFPRNAPLPLSLSGGPHLYGRLGEGGLAGGRANMHYS